MYDNNVIHIILKVKALLKIFSIFKYRALLKTRFLDGVECSLNLNTDVRIHIGSTYSYKAIYQKTTFPQEWKACSIIFLLFALEFIF